MKRKDASVANLAADLAGDPEAGVRVETHIAETHFVSALIALRVQKNSRNAISPREWVSPQVRFAVCRPAPAKT
jgi:hypothetical protein